MLWIDLDLPINRYLVVEAKQENHANNNGREQNFTNVVIENLLIGT